MERWNSQKEALEFVIKYLALGDKSVSSLDIREALDYCAAENNADAQYISYALNYDDARRNHTELSLDDLKSAAHFGIPAAQYDLALHLFYGDYIEKDLVQALNFMELAALKGYLEACRTLVRLFSFDSRIKRNPERALYWRDRLEGGTLADRFDLYPITENDIQHDVQDASHGERKKFDIAFGKLFSVVKQEVVITAPYRTNLIINAGPGTGKTYTLIKRIAYLIREEGIEPDKIAVFSYTRAVVKELKTRLKMEFKEENAAYANVDISTFHKKAYEALQGANKSNEIPKSEKKDLTISRIYYDDCMIYGEDLLSKHPEIISSWQYVVIDEIQDINHAKARFVLKLLEACRINNVPYMLLGDSCQAIYDYLDSYSVDRYMNSSEFYEKIIQGAIDDTGFYSFDLLKNYRSSEAVKAQALPIRRAILGDDEDNLSYEIGQYEEKLNSLDFDDIERFINDHPNDRVCLLERSNINTRFVSSSLKDKGIPNRCMISGLRDAYPQWIGSVFGGYTGESVSIEVMITLFLQAGKTVEDAMTCWDAIGKLDGVNSEIIPMKVLIYKLLAHLLDEVFIEAPQNNFMVSNIHRSKGLEYDYILLDQKVIEDSASGNIIEEQYEEARVLYVAITRAKKETIKLINSDLPSCGRFKSGRHFIERSVRRGIKRLFAMEIMQEIGNMDVDPESFVIPEMAEKQKLINQLSTDEEIELVFSEEKQRYLIVARDNVIGMMRESFTRLVNRNDELPKRFEGLRIDGTYTYIGQPYGYIGFEKKAEVYSPEIGVYKIWNYISFSGLAYAVYDD
jgi:hypothetical protein